MHERPDSTRARRAVHRLSRCAVCATTPTRGTARHHGSRGGDPSPQVLPGAPTTRSSAKSAMTESTLDAESPELVWVTPREPSAAGPSASIAFGWAGDAWKDR